MAEDEQQPAGERQKPKEVMIPASQVKGFLTEMMASVKKDRDEERAEWQERDEAREKEVRDLTKRMNGVEQNPLSKYVEGMDKKAAEVFQASVNDGSFERAIQPVLQNLLPQRIMEQLPELVKKQGPLIASTVREELEERVPAIVERVFAKEESRTEQKIADTYNRIEGVQPATLEETVKRREKKRKDDDLRHQRNRTRNKIVAFAGTLALSVATGLAIYALIDSSRRTADSAVGTADAAKAIARATSDELSKHKSSYAALTMTQAEAKKKDDEARKAELSGLETKLTGEIAKKSDKSDLTTQIADVKKNYTTLDATLKAELAKNNAREEAYGEFKKLADATKKSLDGLANNYDTFSKKAAANDETAATELVKINKSLADAEINIKNYGGLIAKLQTESGANTKESADLRKVYDALLKDYATMTGRVRKLEEKPAGSGNYQPLERDR